jgi:hypothetical protein
MAGDSIPVKPELNLAIDPNDVTFALVWSDQLLGNTVSIALKFCETVVSGKMLCWPTAGVAAIVETNAAAKAYRDATRMGVLP